MLCLARVWTQILLQHLPSFHDRYYGLIQSGLTTCTIPGVYWSARVLNSCKECFGICIPSLFLACHHQMWRLQQPWSLAGTSGKAMKFSRRVRKCCGVPCGVYPRRCRGRRSAIILYWASTDASHMETAFPKVSRKNSSAWEIATYMRFLTLLKCMATCEQINLFGWLITVLHKFPFWFCNQHMLPPVLLSDLTAWIP